MRARSLLSILFATVFLPAGTTGFAGSPLTLTLGGSQHIFAYDREVDDKLTPFGAVEFRFTERWAGEFWYATGETDGDNGFDADIDRWHLNALYYLRSSGGLHPYLAIGGGQLERDWDLPGGALSEVDEEANVGAGAHYFLSDNVSLHGDVRYLFGFDDSTYDFTLSLGVAYRFGAAPKAARAAAPRAAPEVAPRAAPAPEPQRPDSDGDGVHDDMDDCPGTASGSRVDARGCEIKVTRVASIRLLVQFEFDKDEVREHHFADIEDLADFLKRFDDIYVDIEGHTDSIGSLDYNLELSRRRANAVVEILVNEYGIPAHRLKGKGYGESRPIATNDTAEGRAANRRAMATLEVEYEE